MRGIRHIHWFRKDLSLLFAREVGIINDHKPLLTTFKKDVATLS